MRFALGLVAVLACGCSVDVLGEAGQEPAAAPRQELEPAPPSSFERGVHALVQAKKEWRAERGCVSCHTNGWGLAAQPVIAPGSREVLEGRSFAQGYLKKYLDEEARPVGQYGSTEGMVVTAAFLALSDARVGEGIHEVTRMGLDHAWSLLDETGTWEDWLQCNWPPFESDAVYGPTLMLVAVGGLKEKSPLNPKDRAGVERLIAYLKAHPPASLHDKAMRLWASIHWPTLFETPAERDAWVQELMAAQSAGGGWSMASLSGPDWRHDDGKPQRDVDEAYPTAFASYVLLRLDKATSSKDDSQRKWKRANDAVLWLKENQQESGMWRTRSPRRDGKHYIGRTATVFALMVLAEQGQG